MFSIDIRTFLIYGLLLLAQFIMGRAISCIDPNVDDFRVLQDQFQVDTYDSVYITQSRLGQISNDVYMYGYLEMGMDANDAIFRKVTFQNEEEWTKVYDFVPLEYAFDVDYQENYIYALISDINGLYFVRLNTTDGTIDKVSSNTSGDIVSLVKYSAIACSKTSGVVYFSLASVNDGGYICKWSDSLINLS